MNFSCLNLESFLLGKTESDQCELDLCVKNQSPTQEGGLHRDLGQPLGRVHQTSDEEGWVARLDSN